MEAADFSVRQFQGKPFCQSLKHTKLDNILSIATILKVIALFLKLCGIMLRIQNLLRYMVIGSSFFRIVTSKKFYRLWRKMSFSVAAHSVADTLALNA